MGKWSERYNGWVFSSNDDVVTPPIRPAGRRSDVAGRSRKRRRFRRIVTCGADSRTNPAVSGGESADPAFWSHAA